MAKLKTSKKVSKASLVQIIALGLAIFILLPKFGSFSDSFQQISTADWRQLAIIFIFSVLTYVATAFTLKVFSIKPMRLRDSLMIQLAASFTNRLLPSGMGGIAINLQFLRTRGHKTSEATSVLVMSRSMDFAGFLIPTTVIILLSRSQLSNLIHIDSQLKIVLVAASVLAVAGFILTRIKTVRIRITEFLSGARTTLTKLLKNPVAMTKGLMSSTAMNLSFMGAVYFSLRAVGLDIGFLQSSLVFASGATANSASPTPGGLGIVEAAMLGALLALGYPADLSLAGVLLYRLFTYWLPIPFGWLTYRYIINRRLI